MAELDPRLAKQIAKVTAHRARTVIDHILAHGFVTTEELREKYGYHHPPRARMDVLDHGVPIETFRVRDTNGRSIGAYRFGDPAQIEANKSGRAVFSKAFKRLLYDSQNGRCAITGEPLEERYLSIDHRVPYQVEGDERPPEDDPGAFMLIAVWLQRVKSWSCENCVNGKENRDPETCGRCFWASPENYDHIAMEQRRRVDLNWIGDEVSEYDAFQKVAREAGMSVQDWIRYVCKQAAQS